MRAQLIGALAICLLSVSIVEGQTTSEQLQRAIYTQSMLGDLDGAIRQYQQIIKTSPVNSEVRTQAERLLAAAEAYRGRGGARPLGEVSSVYLHRRTGITFEVPRTFHVEGTFPSSDNGEAVMISIPSGDPSTPPWQASVWMITFPTAIDDATIEQLLDDAPLMKTRQRAQDGTGWKLRQGPDGQVSGRSSVGGKSAVSAMADYREGGRAMVESLFWVITNRSRAFFSVRFPAEEIEGRATGMLVPYFGMVHSAKVP